MTSLIFYAASTLLLILCIWICIRPLYRTGTRFNHRIAIAIVLILPLASLGGYLTFGNSQLIGEAWQVQQQSAQTLMTAIEEARAQLEEEPDNIRLILAIAGGESLLGNYQEAITLYRRALQLEGNTPRITIPYVDALILQYGGDVPKDALTLLEELHQQFPANPQALWLLATAAQQREDSPAALAYWQQLLPLAGDYPNIAAQARGQIALLVQQLHPTAVDVLVDLDPLLSYSPESVLFISAHAIVDGSPVPMPVAARKFTHFGFPMHAILDDQHRIGAASLSDHAQLEIRARISNSGVASPGAGDITGRVRWDRGQQAAVVLGTNQQ